MMKHQYVERQTGKVMTEKLCGDRLLNLFYSQAKEDPCRLYRAVSGKIMTEILGFINFDLPLTGQTSAACPFLHGLQINRSEIYDTAESPSNALRTLFERKIRYWECRPMPEGETLVVSPADARVILGSFREISSLFLKEKFFYFEDLLGHNKPEWLRAFSGGDFAVFRLTPDKYHYNHCPVAGTVRDFYEIDGGYHSCNPGAVVAVVTPYSMNKRVVTVIDTDVPGGTRVGLVAMIEVVALMIGDIVQCYSEHRYDSPSPVSPGMFLKKGHPKSLYRPGSSTDVLLFQKDRVEFAGDLIGNMRRKDAISRFSSGFGKPLVETELDVRSFIAVAKP